MRERALSHAGHVIASASALLILGVACSGEGPTAFDAPVASISVTPAAATLVTGDSLQLSATLLDADGDTLSIPRVVWSTSDAQVARVDGSGLVTAAAEGSATITATSGGIDGKASLTVLMTPEPVGFLGYAEPGSKLTHCASCHASKHIGWIGTAHARAWTTLQNSSQSQQFCEACHSVTERGNAQEGAVGHNLTQDGRYHDVQCESCHGPGQEHAVAADPGAVPPHAPISVGGGRDTGCGECHRLAEQPHTEQWQQSRMGTIPNVAIATATDPACLECHEGKTALISRFGETAGHAEKDQGAPIPITCAVCHDPHGSEFQADLRAPISEPSSEFLCLRCHHLRESPPSSSGPHAAQGALLLGEAGWVPPGYEDQVDANRTFTSHGPRTNPRLCLTCHMPKFTVSGQSGGLLYRSVGHNFKAIVCLDSRGIPIPGPCSDEQRYFEACAGSGCHFKEFVRIGDYEPLQDHLNFLLDALWLDSDNDRVIDATDGGLLPQIVARGDTLQLLLTDDSVTVAEGALWNAQLAFNEERPHFGDGEVFGRRFWAGKSSGNGVHNPFLLVTLLGVSIDALRTYFEEQDR